MNKCECDGRLTRDPVVRGSAEAPVVVFTIANNDNPRKTMFFDVVAFGDEAADASKLVKGQKVEVRGPMEPNKYVDKKDVQHHSVQIRAQELVVGLPPARQSAAQKKGDA